MKKSLLFTLLFSLSLTVFAQQNPCTPDVSLQDSTFGLWPDTIQNLPLAQLDTYYEEHIQIKTPATVGDIVQFEVFDTHEIADALNQNGDQTLNGQLTATSGFSIGISSAGTLINQSAGAVSGITSMNFVGTGNTFSYDSSSKTIDISISGSGGGGLGKPVGDTDSIFNYIERFATVTDDITLDTSNAGVNTSIVVTTNPRIVVSDSKTVTVGAAKTLVVDILQIDSLFDA